MKIVASLIALFIISEMKNELLDGNSQFSNIDQIILPDNKSVNDMYVV